VRIQVGGAFLVYKLEVEQRQEARYNTEREMGFNKRYINRENVLAQYRQGIDRLRKYISSPDCLIIADVLSEMVADAVARNAEDEEIKSIIEEWT
jgi:hypothetical protein